VNALVREGTIGIVPAGALGVAFYFHLNRELREMDGRVAFLDRRGSSTSAALRAAGRLRIAREGEVIDVAGAAMWRPDLLACAEEGELPEVLLVCIQPDQLLPAINVVVRLVEWLHEHGALDDGATQLPAVVLCSNGIYFQRVRQFFLEKLEESTLLGRLPDLWPDTMPHLVGKLLRGVTIQTGQREGSGAEAIYRPGLRGRTRLAGGAAAVRARCAALLSARGGWFEAAEDATPTRVEFDKALVNLAVNLLGQLHAIDDAGHFRLLTVREALEAAGDREMRELAQRVLEVGRAVRAFTPADDFETIYPQLLGAAHEVLDHVPSSLQWVAQQLRHGALQPRLTPTEVWLLEPLIRYAHAAGLEQAARYFEDLTRRVEQRLALAIGARGTQR
jgi:hypothetical protein